MLDRIAAPSEIEGAENDHSLVARAVHDADAFAELYHRHARRVFHYLLPYSDTAEDAADITHHVFLRALETLPRYQDRGSPFVVWLLRIARNAATDVYRR